MAHANYNLSSFGIPRMGFFRYRQSTPAPCSPPLGGSDGGSAARFTAAVKYGGRENWPSRRAARCMSGHPCLAHHKLKWARKERSVIGVLYEHLSRSESNKEIARKATPKPILKASPERTGHCTTVFNRISQLKIQSMQFLIKNRAYSYRGELDETNMVQNAFVQAILHVRRRHGW